MRGLARAWVCVCVAAAAFMLACVAANNSKPLPGTYESADIVIENQSDLSGEKEEELVKSIREACGWLAKHRPFYIAAMKRIETKIIISPVLRENFSAGIQSYQPRDIYINARYNRNSVETAKSLMHETTHLLHYNEVLSHKEMLRVHPAMYVALHLSMEFFATIYGKDVLLTTKGGAKRNETLVRKSADPYNHVGADHLYMDFARSYYTNEYMNHALATGIPGNPKIISDGDILALMRKIMQCKSPDIPDLSDETLMLVYSEMKKCADGTSEYIYFDDSKDKTQHNIPRNTLNRFLARCAAWERAAAAKAF